jgi:predicted acetylornithine/succinylornithine family transaminase
MMEEKSYFHRDKSSILNTYNRIPIEISYGEGVYLISKNGDRYLDFFSGLAVNALGYNHPGIKEAINRQIIKYNHLSNYYLNSTQIELAEQLLKYSGMSGVFFTNSGAEAVEAALKIIRKAHGPDKKIISFTNSFHGRTYGSLSLSGKNKYKEAFSPMLPNIKQINFNDIQELKTSVDTNTAAVFIEFLQGEGGINVASNDFVTELKKLRSEIEFAIIADEVQTGIGRTGKPFSFNYFDILPDIILLAKSLGGGLPLGSVLTNHKYSTVLSKGDHGSTFGGNPVACAAGIVIIDEIFENRLFDKVSELGNYFISELNIIKERYPDKISEVRGKGFMIGVEMKCNCSEIIKSLRQKKILTNCTNSNVIRILPPLISQKKDIDFFLYSIDESLKEI